VIIVMNLLLEMVKYFSIKLTIIIISFVILVKKLLKIGEFTSWDEKPICKKCYNDLPQDLRARVEKRLKQEKKAKTGRLKEEAKERKKEQKQNS